MTAVSSPTSPTAATGTTAATQIAVATQLAPASPAEHARRVIAVTFEAWQLPRLSARALARRAPWGYVPVRARRRWRAAALWVGGTGAPPAIAHSW